MNARTFASAAALLLVSSLPALADDLFTLTDGTNTIRFTLPATTSLVQTGVCAGDVNLACALSVPVTTNGVIAVSDYVAFYNATDLGGLTIGAGGGTLLSQSGAVLFNGTLTMPTFKLGNFGLTNYTGTTNTYARNFNLTISSTMPSAVPEPSSIALLGTGLLGIFGVVKKRLV